MEPNVFETANAGFAQAMYEEFLRNPSAVAPEWRKLFESGVAGLDGQDPAAPTAPAAAAGAPKAAPAGGAAGGLPPANATPIKGPAAKLVTNMEESLRVPTATTFRTLAVTALEDRRRRFNVALKAAGRTEKLSFTHLIAYALVQAAKRHPVMGHTLAMHDGVPHRVQPAGVTLGLAVDVQRKDGSRGLVVPTIKGAESLDFAGFLAAYETVVEKARTNKLMPDDFVGATMTLTNPGGLGTVASVPRLMAGQGSIIAVGSIAYPATFAGMAPERIRELGIGKEMTVTSTYDHRVIQGAESGEFLGVIDALLQGEDRFYADIAASLGIADAETAAATAAPQAVTASASSASAPAAAPSMDMLRHVAAGMALVKAFRTHGHLAAQLDPLGTPPVGDPALDLAPLGLTQEIMATIPSEVLRVYVPGRTLADAYPHLQATYCGTIAYEIEHIASHGERVWLREQIESGTYRQPLSADARQRLLQRLAEVETFEKFLHKAYLGQKRFSIEGVDLLVPMLDEAIEHAAASGARDVVIGMAHRGRLNVLAHTIGRPYETIFGEFEGSRQIEKKDPAEEVGTGDVKYHHGAEGAYLTQRGTAITVSLSPNPSHLEFVDPVVDGRARAKQTQRRGSETHHDPSAAVPVLIHGDAAFAGQGVVPETLNLGGLAGYSTGGTLHIITNNQVGFTTDMTDARSTRYASDLARGFDVPILHVNADDPEACLSAVRLAMAYRQRFQNDVVIDLVGYRRHGHNETDEPSYTQPLMYERIRSHPTAHAVYAEALVNAGAVTREAAETAMTAAYQRLTDIQQRLKASGGKTVAREEARKAVIPGQDVETACSAEYLVTINEQLLTWPEGFTPHPKLAKQLERRRTTMGPEGGIDWGHAEALALATLLTDGVPIRFTGQDTERATFSQRHAVLHDVQTGQKHTPLKQLPGALAPFELHNSPLSELATMGFEYGYSAAAPEALVLWEAQFGDFVNGAQIIVDQFLAAGLSKWGLTTRLTLLLPHGYEGQGPEHSSARLERFLQLCAEGNMRVAVPTTAAQYFHLLRRQAKRSRQRPLIIMTPKSLLRLPQASAHLAQLTEGTWRPVLDDLWAAERAKGISRVLACSGKVYYDLLAEAEKLPPEDRPAIIRLEQLYSFPWQEIRETLAKYGDIEELVWVQEEPQNMGAWTYVAPKLRELAAAGGFTVRYAGRPERASPAEGYHAAHVVEQARIVADALQHPRGRAAGKPMAAAGKGQG